MPAWYLTAGPRRKMLPTRVGHIIQVVRSGLMDGNMLGSPIVVGKRAVQSGDSWEIRVRILAECDFGDES